MTTDKLTKTGAAFTTQWLSTNGHDLKKGDIFRSADGTITGTIAGRFTKPDREGNRVPWISCDDAGEKCFRAPAASLTYVPPKPARVRRKPADKLVAELGAAAS